jgi:hypothetical protein
MLLGVQYTAPHKCNRCERGVLLRWSEDEGDDRLHARWKCTCGASEHIVFDRSEFNEEETS